MSLGKKNKEQEADRGSKGMSERQAAEEEKKERRVQAGKERKERTRRNCRQETSGASERKGAR